MKTTTRTFILGVAVLLFISLSISARGDRSVFSFRSVIFPGDTFTQTLGINDPQKVAGYHGATVNKGFIFTFPDHFASEKLYNSTATAYRRLRLSGHRSKSLTKGICASKWSCSRKQAHYVIGNNRDMVEAP